MIRPRMPALLAAFLLATLAGCGGGDGDSGPGPGPGEPPPVTPACPDWPATHQLTETGAMITDVLTVSPCGLLVSGFFGAANPFEPAGDTKGFVLRLTLGADGVVREDWRHLLDSNGTDVVSRIEPYGDGIRYLGWTDGAIAGLPAHGKSDVLIGRLDAAGQPQGLSRLGDERPNRPLRLIDLSGGTHALIGNDEVYVPTNYVEAWEDPWIAGVGSSGGGYGLQWLRRANTAVGDRYFDVVGLADGSLLLARGTDAGPSGGITLERGLPDGTQTWAMQLTQGRFDGVGALHLASPGKALVYGSTFQDLGGGVVGGADLFVVELDLASGASRLVAQLGTIETDWATAMVVTGGRMYLVSETVPADDGAWQARLSQVSSEGVELESSVLSDQPSGVAKAAAVVGSQLVVAGASGPDAATLRGWLRFVPLASAAAAP